MRTYTQAEIYSYLLANPLGTPVHIGDLEDMNGGDYIFLDYLNEIAMTRDDDADYQTVVQISVCTRDFEKRKTLAKYIQDKFLTAASYSRSEESEYYVAQFNVGVFIYADEPGSV